MNAILISVSCEVKIWIRCKGECDITRVNVLPNIPAKIPSPLRKTGDYGQINVCVGQVKISSLCVVSLPTIDPFEAIPDGIRNSGIGTGCRSSLICYDSVFSRNPEGVGRIYTPVLGISVNGYAEGMANIREKTYN